MTLRAVAEASEKVSATHGVSSTAQALIPCSKEHLQRHIEGERDQIRRADSFTEAG